MFLDRYYLQYAENRWYLNPGQQTGDYYDWICAGFVLQWKENTASGWNGRNSIKTT